MNTRKRDCRHPFSDLCMSLTLSVCMSVSVAQNLSDLLKNIQIAARSPALKRVLMCCVDFSR